MVTSRNDLCKLEVAIFLSLSLSLSHSASYKITAHTINRTYPWRKYFVKNVIVQYFLHKSAHITLLSGKVLLLICGKLRRLPPKRTSTRSLDTRMQRTIDRYERYSKDVSINPKTAEQNAQHLKFEVAHMAKKIENLEVSKRKLLGEGLGSCSTEELQQLENQLERSLSSIRGRKTQLFREQIQQLKEKERILTEENAVLCKKVNDLSCGLQPNQQQPTSKEIVPYNDDNQDLEVETELFIGRPERGKVRYPRA